MGAQGLGGCCASVQGCPIVHHEAALISVRTRMKVEVDATTVSTKVQYSGVVTGDGRSCTATVHCSATPDDETMVDEWRDPTYCTGLHENRRGRLESIEVSTLHT